MQFDPRNPIVKLCLQGMDLETQNKPEEALRLFLQAYNEATQDFEKFIAAYYIARHQKEVREKLRWLESVLEMGLKINDDSVKSAFPFLYSTIAKCCEDLKDFENAKKNHELAQASNDKPTDKGPFYHGTRADLKTGDLLTPGKGSNYKSDLTMNHIYFTALLNSAGLAAALANGDTPERVYIIEPTENFENDPNVTDKKFPGNPTRSYRTNGALKITGEAKEWLRQSPEEIQKWREKLANSDGQIIN
ncbi:rRNA adenine methyltransferase [Sphingobacteriaceae bacterium]|nr:rRNA adenine methyltransferase [Sphingobacteriaceae bacterium]